MNLLAVISNMTPGQEYTASQLAAICDTSYQDIGSTLKGAAGGAVQRFKKEGDSVFTYSTDQFSLDLEGTDTMNQEETAASDGPEYCYCSSSETFNKDFPSVCEYAFDFPEAVVGDTTTIHRGTCKKASISEYAPHFDWVLESLSEKAFNAVGEAADGWPDVTADDGNKLNEKLKAAFEEWATETNNQPLFYQVENVEEITVKLVAEDEYQIIESPEGDTNVHH
ncbi:MAG: hypothetical protein V7731_01745 [Amphritea sp.]